MPTGLSGRVPRPGIFPAIPALAAALLALLLPVPLPAETRGIRVLVPPDNASLEAGRIRLIGTTDGAAAPFARIEVGGKVVAFAPVRDGAFHADVALPSGTGSFAVCVGPERKEVPVRVGSAGTYRVHPKLSECEGCHPAGAPGWKIAGPNEPVCGRCHPGLASGKNLHGPLGAGNCTACHDPHGSGNPFLGVHAEGCLACHRAKPRMKFAHGPSRDGKCTACHAHHSAGNRYFLKADGNALCAPCHREPHADHRRAETRPGSRTRLPDGFPLDGEDLACSGCHAPHVSDAKPHLRAAKEEMCGWCHRT